jgi:hypothetical protein
MVVANQDDHVALSGVTEALKNVDAEARLRILKAAATFYGLLLEGTNGDSAAGRDSHYSSTHPQTINSEREPTFSGHADQSAKQFLAEKRPQSDVERVACLAYYLAHYRNVPHFRTVDVSKLNTEAAQFKFSNAAVAVNNAALRGLLTSAGKGNKQISAVGEQFVAALPDRDAAKKALERVRFRRDRGKSRSQRQDAGKREAIR